MRDPVYPLFCIIGIILCALPLPWHWKARNIGTLLYLGWTALGCITFLTNSLVWSGNTDDVLPVWCDISSKLVIGLSVGIPASSLCIQRRLYHIARGHCERSNKSNYPNHTIDLLLGVGLPILVMTLSISVQHLRYSIIEDVGCWPILYHTIAVVPMVLMWPILIGGVSFVYAGRTIYILCKSRRQFSEILSDSSTGFNMSRYFRVMALSATEMAFSLPLSIYFLVSTLRLSPIRPWVPPWELSRSYVLVIDFVSYEVDSHSPARTRAVIDLNRWLVPSCAFAFFIFFGVSSEEHEGYKRGFRRVASLFSIRRRLVKPQASTEPADRTGPEEHTLTARQPNSSQGTKDIESQT